MEGGRRSPGSLSRAGIDRAHGSAVRGHVRLAAPRRTGRRSGGSSARRRALGTVHSPIEISRSASANHASASPPVAKPSARSVGPTADGPARAHTHPTTCSLPGVNRSRNTSPVTPSIAAETTDRACTSGPALVRSVTPGPPTHVGTAEQEPAWLPTRLRERGPGPQDVSIYILFRKEGAARTPVRRPRPTARAWSKASRSARAVTSEIPNASDRSATRTN